MALLKAKVRVGAVPVEKSVDETVRGIVAVRSRGNVNLQLGKYWTEKDKQELREKVSNHKHRAVA